MPLLLPLACNKCAYTTLCLKCVGIRMALHLNEHEPTCSGKCTIKVWLLFGWAEQDRAGPSKVCACADGVQQFQLFQLQLGSFSFEAGAQGRCMREMTSNN